MSSVVGSSAVLLQGLDDVREPRRVDRRACRARPSVAPVSRRTVTIARATSSRGASSSTKRSPSGPCSVAPSPRIASVTGSPRGRGTPMTAVGWNCRNSRSASVGAGRVREPQADPERARRVRRARPQRRGAAGGEHRRRAPGRARPSSSTTPTQRPSARPQRRRRAAPSSTLDARRPRRRAPRGGARRAGRSRCRRRARPGARVAALEPEREVAVAVGVEADAELLEVARRLRGASSTSTRAADCGGRAPRPGELGVARGAGRASRRPRARRPGRPGPSSWRSRASGVAETSATRAPAAAARSAA